MIQAERREKMVRLRSLLDPLLVDDQQQTEHQVNLLLATSQSLQDQQRTLQTSLQTLGREKSESGSVLERTVGEVGARMHEVNVRTNKPGAEAVERVIWPVDAKNEMYVFSRLKVGTLEYWQEVAVGSGRSCVGGCVGRAEVGGRCQEDERTGL